MVTTNQKSVIDIHRNGKKESIQNTKESNQIRREENKGEKEEKKTYKNKSKTIKKMAVRMYILIITLNVNGLNASTKRHRLAKWIQEQDPFICYLQETHFRSRIT